MSDLPITDIHSHILPGIDDGSADWDMTLQMLQMSWDAGVRRLIATPHYLPWRKTIIAEQVPDLCLEAEGRAERELGIRMEIYPGQELYYHRDIMKDLESGRALPLAGSRCVLVEFDEQVPWREMLRAMELFSRSRWQMILAHAERFSAIRDPENLQTALELGILLQSNAEEMGHGFLNGTTRWLKKRYAAREIMFIGSDMHNVSGRPPLTRKSLQWTEKLDREYREELLCRNAEKILTNTI